MKRIFSSHRWILPVLSAALLVGCFATAARWMVYVAVDPDHFNRVLVDSSGQVVHVYEPDTGLHLTTYAADGAVVQSSQSTASATGYTGTLDISNQQQLIIKATLAESLLVNADTHQVTALDSSLVPAATATWPLTGVASALDGKVVAFGTQDSQGWLLIMDFTTGASELLQPAGVAAITTVHGASGMMLETAAPRQVISYDTDLNELARYSLSDGNETLIGDSLGRPVLFNTSNHDLRVTDTAGVTIWTFENSELETIEGHQVGPDGGILLWGDNSNLNPLLGVRLDSAHFLRVSATGELQYHYLGGGDMAQIRYTHVKQFEDGLAQISYQGSKGQLTGFVLGNDLATPFTITREVFHDFVSPLGNRVRYMREPRRSETYAQCGSICVSLLDDVEGHCDNLDVTTIDRASLASVSQVCGALSEEGMLLPDTVKVSLY
ncbi:MAG: hypothetical protein CML06_07035 [Pseudomonadales bacterium]|nr:hypothetical protein [Pseudomonadales bacterium]